MVFIAEQHCPPSTCWDPHSTLLSSSASPCCTSSACSGQHLSSSLPPFLSPFHVPLAHCSERHTSQPLPPSSCRGSWRRETSCTRSDPPLPIMHYLSHTTQINSTLDQPLKAWMITLNNSVKQKQKGFCHFSPFAVPPNWLFSIVTVSACAYYLTYFSISLLHSMLVFIFIYFSFSHCKSLPKTKQKQMLMG